VLVAGIRGFWGFRGAFTFLLMQILPVSLINSQCHFMKFGIIARLWESFIEVILDMFRESLVCTLIIGMIIPLGLSLVLCELNKVLSCFSIVFHLEVF